MTEILINQSVAILCDGNNIERSIHTLSKSTKAMINFDELIPKLLNGRGLNRLIYFREGKSISEKFAERLHENYYGSVVPCHKSADIPLSIKATQLASKVDTIIIMSGDSDFVELVTHLKAEGVRVEIAASNPNDLWFDRGFCYDWTVAIVFPAKNVMRQKMCAARHTRGI